MEMVINNRLWIPIKAWRNIPKEKRKRIILNFKKVYVSPTEYCDLRSNNRTCYHYDNILEDAGEKAANDLCYECSMAQKKAVCCFKNDNHVSFYRGDIEKIDDVIKLAKKYNKGIKLKDSRVEAPLAKKIKINSSGDERTKAQNSLAEKYVKKGYGILVAPARFGKNRTSLVVFSLLKQRTFVFAHQRELLEQIQSNWVKFSNLKENEIQINPSIEDSKRIPVSLFTYQHFLHKNGEKRLKELCRVPGFILCDEVHRGAATAFNRILNAFHAKYRLGMSATPDRKDKMSFLIYNTFGPITAKGGSEMLTCKYKIVKTGSIFSDYDRVPHRRRFTLLNKVISKDEERSALIARRAVRNVDKGYQVLIPLKNIEHVKKVADLVRKGLKKLHFNKIKVCEYSASFLKGKKREEVSQQIRDGYYDVVVAIESMIDVGFDAPHMSNLVLNAGTYSFNKENRYQLFSRIRTKCEGKKTPLIDILQDECKWSNYSTKGIVDQMEEFGFKEVQSKKRKK